MCWIINRNLTVCTISALKMSALVLQLTTVLLLLSVPQKGAERSEDEDLVQEFRDLFSEFLTEQDRPPAKHIRDTSKVERKWSDGKSDAGTQPEPSEERENDKPSLSPLYSCNHFDVRSRLCVNVRQLGTTLTVGVRNTGVPVHWYRVFAVKGRGDNKEQFTFVDFTRDNLPWNVNLGGENNELRISPLTEIDFSYNFFLATLENAKPAKDRLKKGHHQLLMFSIEPISIDMGPLYHGEEITINARSHMELPPHSVRYEWARVSGPDFLTTRNLPSNMRLSRDGSALVIKEHRNYGRGDVTLTCAVYSNRNVSLARRNFFLRKISAKKHQNTKVSRKRRFLDEFYAQEERGDPVLPSLKYKRDILLQSSPSGIDDWTEASTEFSRVANSFEQKEGADEESTPRFSIDDKPKETVLNFFGGQRSLSGSQEEDDEGEILESAPENRAEANVQPSQAALDELIHEANGIMEDDGGGAKDFVKEDSLTTVRIVSEMTPTFEDKESMLIADCDRDQDCGVNAVCIRVEGSKKFCRCRPHYRGDGLFCWSF